VRRASISTAEGRKAIADYKINGEQLFYPNRPERVMRTPVSSPIGFLCVALVTLLEPASAARMVAKTSHGRLRF
jgi:hypothetical protein